MTQQINTNYGIQYIPQIAAAEQIVYLDFDGELTDYNGEILTVNDVEVIDPELSQERLEKIVSELNKIYLSSNVKFVTEIPLDSEYSTIYIGKTSAFDKYGDFAGLAENIDEDNQNKSDNAFVMLDSASSDEQIISVISHETDHLLGTLDHGGEGLAAYAVQTNIGAGTTSTGLIISSGDSLSVSYGGAANSTIVNSGGNMHVISSGMANNTVINSGGSMHVASYGIANDTTINYRGSMFVPNGGIVNNVRIDSGACAFFYSGSVLTGSNSIAGIVNVVSPLNADGATINFAVDQRLVRDNYIINNFSMIQGTPTYTITVAANQLAGLYKLAQKAAGFDATLSIGDGNVNYGSLTVNGESLSYGSRSYQLILDSNTNLLLSVTEEAQGDMIKPVISSVSIAQFEDVYTFKVTVNATDNENTASELAYEVRYSENANMSNAQTVSGTTFTLSELDVGKTYYYQVSVTDKSGNSTESSIYEFNVNDATAPVFEAVSYSAIHGTMVTVVWEAASDNVGVKGYYLTVDGKRYSVSDTRYTVYKLAFGNHTYSITAFDAAGNESAESEIRSFYVPDTSATGEYVRIYSNGIQFLKGAIVNDVLLNEGGNDSMTIMSGGTANNTKVDFGNVVVNGGTANNTTIERGTVALNMNGTVNNTIVNLFGHVNVGSLGIANSTIVNSRGQINVMGKANYTTVNSGGSMNVSSGGIANGTVISSGGRVYISSGGTAAGTEIKSSGEMAVSSGGIVKNTAVYLFGRLNIGSGAKHTGTLYLEKGVSVESSGQVNVASGGIVDFTVADRTVNDAYLINDLRLIIGTPTFTVTVSANQAEGTYKLAQQANRLTGAISIGDTTAVYGSITVNGDDFVYNDTTYSLDLVNGNLTLSVFVNDIVPPEAPQISVSNSELTNQNVTVSAIFSADSVKKQYSLNGIDWFDYVGGVVFEQNGNISFRGIDSADNISEVVEYRVTNIDKVAPEKPSCSADITDLTNKNVTVSAVFAADSVKNEYSLDGRNWFVYNTAIVFEKNGSVYFRSTDTAGNISDIAKYDVVNIDKTAPTLEISGNPTEWTNKDVVLTAVADDGVIEYLVGTNWVAGSTLTVAENGTYKFRVTDSVGNVTEETVIVDKIDKVAPEKPSCSANITDLTNKNVTVNAVFAADSVKNEYSLDGRNWLVYNTAIVFEKNGSVYFRSTDAAGNISETANYDVNNIDKTAPTLEISGNPTEWTNKDVVLTAVADDGVIEYLVGTNWVAGSTLTVAENGTYKFRATDDAGNIIEQEVIVDKIDKTAPTLKINGNPAEFTNKNVVLTAVSDEGVIEYFNGTNWVAGSTLTVAENGTYKFRVTDLAGNVSEETVIVDKIDKFAPAKPSVGADITALTNKNVTVSAVFAADSVKNEYSLDSKNWHIYTAPVTLEKNGSVYFRSTDTAGNVSDIAKYDVSNIDKSAPYVLLKDVIQQQNGYTFNAAIDANDNISSNAELSYVVRYSQNIDQLMQASAKRGTSFSVSAADAGKNFFCCVEVTDKAGNTAVSNILQFNVKDYTAPNVPNATARTNENSVRIFWSATYDNVGVAGYYLYVNDKKYTVYDTEITLNDLPNGQYTYRICAFDKAGNVSAWSAEKKFECHKFVDTEPPYIVSCKLTQEKSGYDFNATVSASDNHSSANDLVYYIKYSQSMAGLNTAEVIEGKSFSLDSSDAGQIFYYQVGVADVAGNIAWTTGRSFYVNDVTAPELNGIPKVTVDNRIINFSWNAASDNSNVAGYLLTVNGRTYNTSNTEIALNNFADGVYSYTLQAFDNAGNRSSAYNGQFKVSSPDLKFYTLPGWDDSVVISSSTAQADKFTTEDVLTIDWAVLNDSSVRTENGFYVSLYVDDVLTKLWYSNTLGAGSSISVKDYSIGCLSGGTHQIKLVADLYNAVPESNENNNTFISNIIVSEVADDDDSFSEAVKIANGSYINAIDFSTDVDMYSIDVYAGNTVTITTSTATVPNADTYLRLFDAQGNELAVADDISYYNRFSSLTYTFDQSGTYYFSVSTNKNKTFDPVTGGGDVASDKGNYKVSVSGIINSKNLFDSAIDLGTVAKNGYTESPLQHIASSKDVHMFKVTVTDGQAVYFDVDHKNGSSSWDSYMRIFDENGREITFNNDGIAPGEARSLEAYTEYTFAKGGTYYIGISAVGNETYNPLVFTGDGSGKSIGYYTLSVGECRTLDNDDQISEAKVLSVGKSISGLISDEYDVDMYRVYASANQTILFELALADLRDGYLRLFDANGRELSFNDDVAGSKNSEIEYTFSSTGYYYVGVSSVGNKKYNAVNGENDASSPLRGGYNLSARIIEKNDDRYENNDYIWNAADLGHLSGSKTIENLKFNDSDDWYKFTIDGNLAAESTISIDFDNSKGDLDIYLYNAQSYALIKFSNSSDDREMISLANLEAGEYALRVYQYNNTGNQDYSLSYTVEEKTVSDPTNYVVLFSGGVGIEDNHVRYYHNIKNIYNTLVASGIERENIYVLFADGNDPAEDLYETTSKNSGKYLNSDMSFAAGSNVYSATASNLRYIMDLMSVKVTDQDHFMFYSYDHGAQDNEGNDYICCWDRLFVSDKDFAVYANNINAKYSTYIMSQCYSGGMLEDITLKNNMFMCSAADNAHPSHTQINFENPEYSAGFSRGILEGLQKGIFNTHALYQYALSKNLFNNIDFPQKYGQSFDIFQNLNGRGRNFESQTGLTYEENINTENSNISNENIDNNENTGNEINSAPEIFNVEISDINQKLITNAHASDMIFIETAAADPDGDMILKLNYYLIDESGKAELIGTDSGFNTYTWRISENILPGNYKLAVAVEDIYHNESEYFITDFEIRGIDTAPEISGMNISAQFSSVGDEVIISGKVFDAENDVVDGVRIYFDSNHNNNGEFVDELLGTARVDANGEWSYTFTVPEDISFGSYKLFAAAVNSQMNESEQIAVELKVVHSSGGRIISVSNGENTQMRIFNEDMTKYFTVDLNDKLINVISLADNKIICDNGSEQIEIGKFENTELQQVNLQSDSVSDVFIGRATGVWNNGYFAQHLGDGYNEGTGEKYTLAGKNRISDIYTASDDIAMLVLTDDANGDALFIDDIFSALPGTVAEQQARISNIDEIRAGAGDDIIDMTSAEFSYTGETTVVYGGSGNDVIWANNGENKLFGDSGNDRIVGGYGNDIIVGGSGNDSLHGGGGDDIFTFGGDWGSDTVEQFADGKVTLWFEEGSADGWDADTLTYSDGQNSVTVSGVSGENIMLKFGDVEMAVEGAFADSVNDNIYKDKDSGMLA